MAFTNEDRRDWHETRRAHEPRVVPRPIPTVAICMHCSNPFGHSEGVVTDEFALCDVCNGD